MKESSLKKQILVFMLIAKFITVCYILFHWQTGGFSMTETLATITLILPLFTVYITLMIKDAVKNPYKTTEVKEQEKRIKGSFRTLTYIVLPIYLLLILYLISLKPRPNAFTFENLQTAVAAVESGFGIYIAQIIFAVFKKEEKNN